MLKNLLEKENTMKQKYGKYTLDLTSLGIFQFVDTTQIDITSFLSEEQKNLLFCDINQDKEIDIIWKSFYANVDGFTLDYGTESPEKIKITRIKTLHNKIKSYFILNSIIEDDNTELPFYVQVSIVKVDDEIMLNLFATKMNIQ